MHPDVPPSTDPIAQVTTGMRVVDASGAELGRVVHVEAGDPNAVTVQEPPGGDGVLSDKVTNPAHGDEPDVAPDVAARLLRGGYLKVDRSSGLPGQKCYVDAARIARVHADVVKLTVTGGELDT